MPIRINLKELFPADSQELTVDKINFNFNKLLELGVGQLGPIGLTGSLGPAGPIGGIGLQGVRGSTWFVDAGNPTLTDGLLDGDLYLDSDLLAVWQWDADSQSWIFLFDISQIVQNYLEEAASPFIRGFGSGSPSDQRFIVFGKKNDDSGNDETGSAASQNDVLFLSNYDEAVRLNPEVFTSGSPSTSNYYNSLLTISVDPNSGGVTRSHIELGTIIDSGLNAELTSSNENFKARYERIPNSVHSGLNYYNKQIFSLDLLPSIGSSDRNFNGIFAFEVAKYRPDDYPSGFSSDSVTVMVGSRYGLNEEVSGSLSGDVLADGIGIIGANGFFANIGVATDYSIPGVEVDTGYLDGSTTANYLVLDSREGSDSAGSLLLNRPTYQTGGNIVQLGTSEARVADWLNTDIENFLPSTSVLSVGVAARGSSLYVFGADSDLAGGIIAGKKSYFAKLNIANPNRISLDANTEFPATGAVATAYSAASKTQPYAYGASDIAIAGEIMYVVNNLPDDFIGIDTPFRVLQLDSVSTPSQANSFPDQLGKVPNQDFYDLVCAHRVKLAGSHAIVAGNALPHNSGINSLNVDAKIAAVNLSCNTSPRVSSSIIGNKNFIGGTIMNAFLDLVVVENTAYTLTWEQKLDSSLASVRVHVDSFDISDSSAISFFRTTEVPYFSSSSVNSAVYSNLSKTGAIDATHQYIGSAYSVYNVGSDSYELQFRIFSTVESVLVSASAKLKQLSLLVVDSNEIISSVTDLKWAGNSVYILGNSDQGHSFLFKIDVSQISEPKLVWQKKIETVSQEWSAVRLAMVGKNFYVVIQNLADSNIVAVDFDGLYTGGAHIESLRADSAQVSEELTVGRQLNTGRLNVGNDASFSGEVSISGNLKVCSQSSISGPGTIPLGGIIMWSGSIATIPSGWALCDGTNGTPNLLERFIVGAGGDNLTVAGSSGYTPGNTGGSNTITLDRTNLPPHRHTFSFLHRDRGGNYQQWETRYETATGGKTDPSDGSVGIRQTLGVDSGSADSNDTQFWMGGGNSGNGTNNVADQDEIANGTGSVTPFENRPPYYALAFIMRIS